MSISRRIAFATTANWLSRGVAILLGFALMPVLFRNLPKEELGVWLILAQSAAFLGFLDMGFALTLTRRIAFANASAPQNNESPASTTESTVEIATLIATAKRIYSVISIFAFVISFSSGFLYLRGLHLHEVSLSAAWIAWAVLCSSHALTVLATPWTCLLQGVGYVGWEAILASMVNVLVLLVQICFVLTGFGLVALALTSATGALLQRTIFLRFARRKRPELFRLSGHWCGKTFRSMVPLALKSWITMFGITVVFNSDQFFVTRLSGMADFPAYRAAYVVLLNINMLAGCIAPASAVFVAQLWKSDRILEIHRIVARNLRLGLLIMGTGGGLILGLGERFFDLWLGPGNFVGNQILIVFLLLLFLELQCYIISTASRATEDEAFAPWALSSASLKLILSWSLGLKYGLVGIALGTLFAQICTNHWYMVYRGLERLNIRFSWYCSNVLAPVLGTSILVTLSTNIISNSLVTSQPLVGLAAASITAGVILVLGLWFLVLEPQHRRKIFSFAALT